MALRKIEAPIGGQAPTSTDDYIKQNNILTTLMIGLDGNPLGNYADSAKPYIKEGAVIRHGGALYWVPVGEGDLQIGGAPSNGDAYIRLVPNGDASILSPSFVNSWTAEYNHAYKGWYYGNTQFLPYGMTVAGADYKDKFEYYIPASRKHKAYWNGDLELDNMTANGQLVAQDMISVNSTVTAQAISVSGTVTAQAISGLILV